MRARGRHAARAATTVIVAGALLAATHPAKPALARMTDVETVPVTVSTETLDPPTSLTAVATLGLIVQLDWTATVDVRATGYQVLRSTTSGGPYAIVATITPRTTTTHADLPLVPARYFYVVRTYFGPWTSVNSNERSVLAL
jgi:hypothetical protein